MYGTSIETLADRESGTPASVALEDMATQWAVLLTTYRRDGTPVGTPVNIVVDGARAYFRTYDRSGKVKRLARNARVEIAPCTWRGRPTGPGIRATARPLAGARAERAATLIDAKHPFFQRILVRLGHGLQRYRTVYYELIADQPTAAPATLAG